MNSWDLEFFQAKVDDCRNSGGYPETVNHQVTEGTRLGVRVWATPAFINVPPLFGAQSFAAVQLVTELMLAGQ